MRMAISDHDLGGVFVGHDDSRLRQLRSSGAWVVRHERFLAHAHVLNGVHFVRILRP